MAETMKALLLRQHGGLENLELVTNHPKPKATEGNVVIRVRASSFNYHDVFTVKGMPGIKVPLPVEVLPFGQETQEAFFRSLGAEPTLRRVGGMIVNTDNGNVIYDCKFPQIANPVEIDRRISQRAGVVGTGLFIGLASTVLVADDKAVTRLDRKT